MIFVKIFVYVVCLVAVANAAANFWQNRAWPPYQQAWRHNYHMHHHKPRFPFNRPFPNMDVNYFPSSGENFSGSSIYSSSYSSNSDGNRKSGGSFHAIVNDNGEIKEQSYTW